MSKIKVVVVEPKKAPYEKEIENDLTSMQKIVGGYIEIAYPFVDHVCIVCNEEGKILGLPMNRMLVRENPKFNDMLYGTFFICGDTGDNFCSLSESQLKYYLNIFDC